MNRDVRLRVESPLPERLLQRALAQGAAFTRVQRLDSRALLIETDPRSAGIVLELCRRFSLPARVLERRGRTALGDFLRMRRTLFVGVALCALLCGLFLGRVWRVDVRFTGDAAALGDRSRFVQALDALGVRPGVSRNIDTALLSQELAAAAEGYSFVGARLQGVRLLVEAAPEAPAPKVYDVEFARDLYCARDGVVLSATAQRGALCVRPGDTVRRGQVLIRGEEMASKDETRPIGALGEVVVRAWVAGSAEVPMTTRAVRLTGKRAAASRLRLPWFEWPLSECEGFASQVAETEILPIGGLFLPLEIQRDTLRETRVEEIPIDRDAAEARAAALAMADASARLSAEGLENCEIVKTWTRCENAGESALRCVAVLEITVNAAVTRDVLLYGG